jgi:hypothetical protein
VRGRGLGSTLWWASLGLLAALPASASAQAGFGVLGRASDAESGVPVQNAIATLEGFGSTLTEADGAFRFRGVEPGTYTLRVEAFSYATASVEVTVPMNGRIDVALESSPLALDSIVVEAGAVDYHGRVRDPERDFDLVDAQVLVRGRDPMWTDAHGRFDVDGLPEGVPVSLSVRAFGYLPVDTTLVPDDEERYEFDLARDPFAEAMIATQVRRLEERAGGWVMAGKGVMDRDEVLRYATGGHTAGSMLEFEYPQRTLERIICTFVDEEQVDVNPLTGKELADFVLGHTLPEEIERVELLQIDYAAGRPLILQVFTRSFIMTMATQDIPLKKRTVTPFGQCF